jgi:transposase
MKMKTGLEERAQIIELSASGLSARAVGQRLGLSEGTVRKWRRRYKRDGRKGLGSVMGRPDQGALSSYPAEVRTTIQRWREEHPGWGAKTLRAELSRHPAFAGQKIPGQASIGRYVKDMEMSRPYERHQELPHKKYQPAERLHQIWEMDARGYAYIPEVGVIGLINLNDRLSHARLVSYPCWLGERRCQRHPDTLDYQTVLRLAFTQWGLPEQMQLDHDSVFHDNTSQSPFPTHLHLWLLALGVDLTFSRDSRPTDQGMTERSHQLWDAQCLQGQTYLEWDDLYLALQHRLDFLNYDLPCASLNHQPPLLAFPDAVHSGRAYRPEYEADLLDLNRVWAYLAHGRWFRRSSKDFTFSLGRQVYYIGRPWKHTQLDITFDPTTLCLNCHDDTGNLFAHCPIKGLSVQPLLGDPLTYAKLPFFQLALPFDWNAQRVLRLFETLPS